MKRLAIILLSARIIGGAPALASDPRLWTDARGTQINGTFIKRSESGTTIHIRHSDRKSISIPMAELSVSDKLYVMERSAKDFRDALSPDEPSVFVIRRSSGMDREHYSISREIDAGNGIMLELSTRPTKQGNPHTFGSFVISARAKSPDTQLDVISLKQTVFRIDGESYTPTWMVGVRGFRDSCKWSVPHTWFERIANATEVEGHFGGQPFHLTHDQREGFRVLLDHVEARSGKKPKDGEEPSLNNKRVSEKENLTYHASRIIEVAPRLLIGFSAERVNAEMKQVPVRFEIQVSSEWRQHRLSDGYVEFVIDGKYLSRYPGKRRIVKKRPWVGGRVDGNSVTERNTYRFSPELFGRIAEADIVDLRIGQSVFTVTYEQRDAMRTLWEYMLTPDPGARDELKKEPTARPSSFVFATEEFSIPESERSTSSPLDLGDSFTLTFGRVHENEWSPYRPNAFTLDLSSASRKIRFPFHHSQTAEIEMDGYVLNVVAPRVGGYLDEEGVVYEGMAFRLTPKVFGRMARAQNVVLQVGAFRFPLSHEQRDVMRHLMNPESTPVEQ